LNLWNSVQSAKDAFGAGVGRSGGDSSILCGRVGDGLHALHALHIKHAWSILHPGAVFRNADLSNSFAIPFAAA
jgi:hypothetical protein